MLSNKYSDQVFINCPFDREFTPIFRSFCFAVLDCGFVPRCALEIDDGTQFRLGAIVKLVKQCQYGVHDLSRVELDTATRLPRFNMPFELGVFYSAKAFGGQLHKKKCCIIFEKEKYRYRKFLSDISGLDVVPHGDTMKKSVFAIRDWLVTSSRRKTIPLAVDMYNRFRSFNRVINKICREKGVDYNQMPFLEVLTNMSDWLRQNQAISHPLFR